MWIFDFLFGRRERPAGGRAKGKLPSGQICQARHKPAGTWVAATLVTEVVGLHHRRNEAEAFVKEAHRADQKGTKYGVRLEPEPGNPHDKNAVKVLGEVSDRGEWHIGYLSRDVAADLSRDLLASDTPIAGELYKIYVSTNGFIEVKVIVLAPPGNSEKARRKRGAKASTSY